MSTLLKRFRRPGWPKVEKASSSTTSQRVESLNETDDLDTETAAATTGSTGGQNRPLRTCDPTENRACYDGLEDDEFRILSIHPGQTNAPLVCNLKPIKFSDEIEYVALSYCWSYVGHRTFDMILPSRETTCANSFAVSEDLFSALKRLREDSTIRNVWIDAICINQLDTRERSSQVSHMREIYSKAQRTVIWLGETEPSEETCRRRPDGTCMDPRYSVFDHGYMTSTFCTKLMQDEKRSTEEAHWKRVWWKRIWVLQEFAMSRTAPLVLIGPHTISWDYFAAMQWQEKDDHLFLRLRKGGSHSLSELLILTRDFACANPEDRVWALLGLLTDKTLEMEIDYTKHFSLVYAEAALHMVRWEHTLDLLLDARRNRSDGHSPATWCPDFKRLRHKSYAKGSNGYAASTQSPEVTLCDIYDLPPCSCGSRLCLETRGVPFGKIVSRIDLRDLPSCRVLYDENTACIRRAYPSEVFSIVGYDARSDPPMALAIARAFRGERITYPETIAQRIKSSYKTTEAILHGLGLDSEETCNRFPLSNTPLIGMLILEFIFDGTKNVADCIGPPEQNNDIRTHTLLKIGLESAQLKAKALASQFGLGTSKRLLKDLEVALRWEHIMTCKLDENNLWPSLKLRSLPDSNRESLPFGNPHTLRHIRLPKGGIERTFFRTEDGFVGLGSDTLEVGHEIVVPFGSSRPWIVKNHGDHYVFVGDAVIPGIMSGQLTDLCDAGAIESRKYLFL